MIYTVTLNPASDKTLAVDRLEPGAVHRADVVRLAMGGKGINVSRTLRALGVDNRVLAIIGGGTGQALKRGLLADGFNCEFIEVPGKTRQNITLFDRQRNEYTKINELGPALNLEQSAALVSRMEMLARPGDLWALSGSLPQGLPPEFYGLLIEALQSKGARTFLDTNGLPLKKSVAARPYAIKPNFEEAAELAAFPLSGEEDVVQAIGELISGGLSLVAITAGAAGLYLGMDGTLVKAVPPVVQAPIGLGAGDAALAGLLWATDEGCDPLETARRAAACGTAAAMQDRDSAGDQTVVEELLPKITVTVLGDAPAA